MSKLLSSSLRQKISRQFPQLKKTAYFSSASIGPWPKVTEAALQKQISLWHDLIDPTPTVFDYWRELKVELGKMVNASPDEIGYALNTSYGLAIAASGIEFRRGDEVLLCDVEFPANTYPWTNLEYKGVKVKFLKSSNRCFNIEAFEQAITSRTKVLSISFVQFFNGYKNDIERLGKICRKHNIFYIVDAIQGCGSIPIDVKKCDIDLLASGAQKWLLAPVGSGFFYLNKNAKLDLRPAFAGWFGIDWGGNWLDLLRHNLKPEKTVDRFNLSAMPYFQIFGMHSSIKLINSIGVDNIYRHNLALIDRLIDFVDSDPRYYHAFEQVPEHRSCIFSFGCAQPKETVKYLSKLGIKTTCRENLVRVAVHFYNTPKHINRLIDALKNQAILK